MEPQAQGPAQAQVQTPVHPVHQETADHAALLKYVQENPDNDPEHPENSSATPGEVKEEAKTEEPKEGPQEHFELPEDEPLFEIEYKTDSGKEQKKLSLKELREGYLAKQDYHRNIQKVKAQEAEIQQRAQQAEQQAIAQYVQKLETHQQAIQKLAGVRSMQEIEALAKEDPAGAQQEFLRFINVNQQMQALEAEKQQAIQKHQQVLGLARQKAIEAARQTLESDIPGWNAETYNKVLGAVSSDYGFKKEEVEQVIDARLIKVFNDAYQYRQLQKAKPEISKKVVAVPKVIKPGSAEKPNPAKEETDRSYSQFKKSGRGEDFVRWYMNKNNKGK